MWRLTQRLPQRSGLVRHDIARNLDLATPDPRRRFPGAALHRSKDRYCAAPFGHRDRFASIRLIEEGETFCLEFGCVDGSGAHALIIPVI